MKTINDNTLDQLISQSLQRQHSIESINTQVLAAVKRYNRRQKTIRALRAFCGCMPQRRVQLG